MLSYAVSKTRNLSLYWVTSSLVSNRILEPRQISIHTTLLATKYGALSTRCTAQHCSPIFFYFAFTQNELWTTQQRPLPLTTAITKSYKIAAAKNKWISSNALGLPLPLLLFFHLHFTCIHFFHLGWSLFLSLEVKSASLNWMEKKREKKLRIKQTGITETILWSRWIWT